MVNTWIHSAINQFSSKCQCCPSSQKKDINLLKLEWGKKPLMRVSTAGGGGGRHMNKAGKGALQYLCYPKPLSTTKETPASQPGGRKCVFCEKLYLQDWFYPSGPNDIHSSLKRILISSEPVPLLAEWAWPDQPDIQCPMLGWGEMPPLVFSINQRAGYSTLNGRELWHEAGQTFYEHHTLDSHQLPEDLLSSNVTKPVTLQEITLCMKLSLTKSEEFLSPLQHKTSVLWLLWEVSFFDPHCAPDLFLFSLKHFPFFLPLPHKPQLFSYYKHQK